MTHEEACQAIEYILEAGKIIGESNTIISNVLLTIATGLVKELEEDLNLDIANPNIKKEIDDYTKLIKEE